MSKREKLLDKLRENLIDFFTDLMVIFPSNQTFFDAKVILSTGVIPMGFVMTGLLEHLEPHRKQIKDRNEEFFLNEPKIFEIFEQKDKTGKLKGDIFNIKSVWIHKDFTKDNKNAIWAWIDRFLLFIERYQKC